VGNPSSSPQVFMTSQGTDAWGGPPTPLPLSLDSSHTASQAHPSSGLTAPSFASSRGFPLTLCVPPDPFSLYLLSFSLSLFFPPYGGMEFELRTSCLLARQVLYHLSHNSSSFCSGYFGDGGLSNYLLRLALNPDSLELSLPSS
jgi:hypothetical protein